MKKYRLALLLPLFAIGCSDDNDLPAPKTNDEASASTQAAPKKISDDNPFATQVNALGTAKAVGAAAQKSIDANQQKLDEAGH
ncbi:MAG: hypothetical protein OQK32_05595 [Gammaproteobacteria bacterium]|nr:hypothetical protein [Gammaproteobacteria bacterium]